MWPGSAAWIARPRARAAVVLAVLVPLAFLLGACSARFAALSTRATGATLLVLWLILFWMYRRKIFLRI